MQIVILNTILSGRVIQSMRAATKKKREHMMEVALKLFTEQGYENVSVDDIIAATNTSKGTFYHYFNSKEEIISHIMYKQDSIIEKWAKLPASKVISLESHINQLFLDLSSNISSSRTLIRSLSAIQLHSTELRKQQMKQVELLKTAIMRWLPEPIKVDLLVASFYGIMKLWYLQDKGDLMEAMQISLTRIWSGIRSDQNSEVVTMDSSQSMNEVKKLKVAIIGGGLAGLTAAAYLSENDLVEGTLFERSPQLGGRAFTYEKEGFTLNYGAHAIYGLDRHTIKNLEDELGLSFGSQQVDKRKVMYEKYDHITEAPLDFVNLMKTELLTTMQKVKFVAEITAIISNIHQLKKYATLGDFLAESDTEEDVKELWEHLVCSNFFISPEDARKVPGSVINNYYQNLFLSSRPVNYILGSWAVITNQLKQKIELSNRWNIALKEGVEGIHYSDGKFYLQTKNNEQTFDKIIFAMPIQQVLKVMKHTPWEPFFAPYEHNTATEVMVYDIGLSHVVARPFHYISDMNNKMFISDVSATDHTIAPQGSQLLQAIAYLPDENFRSEEEKKQYLDERIEKMEQLFDRHYPGWREAVVVKRVSKKAMVQSVKNIVTNKLVPNQIENIPFYFCGDGCEGKGELAERAFSSARNVAMKILKDIKPL